VPAIKVLQRLAGRRLFLYQDAEQVRAIRTREVNAFLCDVASCKVSCKDFRTLRASMNVVETLLRTDRAEGPTRRKRQVKKAVQVAADDLTNTATICRKSYVHEAVVEAFEQGKLSDVKKSSGGRYPPARQILAEVINVQSSR
jgi:DNA topoisomerase-1